MAKAIKPCPFCGSKDIEYAGGAFTLTCNNCGALGPTDYEGKEFQTIEDAFIDAWNERVATDG
jgi:Lar family restriction alleviation protein